MSEPSIVLAIRVASSGKTRTSDQPVRLPGSPPTFLAPMEGVTHPILREMIAARGGVGVVCTEFVRVTAQPLTRKTLHKHIVRPSRGLLSVQVMGNHIEQMAEATKLVTDFGADVVDINLGCPAPRAVRKGVGSALLKDLGLLARVLERMRSSTCLPLSAKIRAGFDDASSALSVARVVEKCGADFITVHPRRRIDFYQGTADWRIIALLVKELGIPVVGNGDIWYAADALRMERETGCCAVMLGRPALRNPFIFGQIAALRQGVSPLHPDGAALLAHLRELAQALLSGYSPLASLGMLKEQLRYVARAVSDGGSFGREILRLTTVGEVLDYAERTLSPLDGEQLDLQATTGALETCGSALEPTGRRAQLPSSTSELEDRRTPRCEVASAG